MKFTFFFFKLPFTMYSIVWTVKTYWEPKLFYKFSTSVDHIFRSNLLSMFAEWPSFGTNSVKPVKMYFESEYCYHYSKITKLTSCGSIHTIVQISLQCYNNNDYKSENDLRDIDIHTAPSIILSWFWQNWWFYFFLKTCLHTWTNDC